MSYRRHVGHLFWCPILLVLCVSCSTDDSADSDGPEGRVPIEYSVHEVPEPRADLCILSYGTTFKSQVLDVVVGEFGAREMNVVVDDMERWAMYPASEYDAVVLISGIEAFRTLPEGAKYIKSNDYSPNIVYFFTYTGTEWPYGRGLDKTRIDAITSVSTPDDSTIIRDAADRIIQRVETAVAM